MNETLYEFIQRTLIRQEYERKQGAMGLELRLLTGEEKIRPMEMSYVVNPGAIRIKDIIKWE